MEVMDAIVIPWLPHVVVEEPESLAGELVEKIESWLRKQIKTLSECRN